MPAPRPVSQRPKWNPSTFECPDCTRTFAPQTIRTMRAGGTERCHRCHDQLVNDPTRCTDCGKPVGTGARYVSDLGIVHGRGRCPDRHTRRRRRKVTT